MKFKIGFVNYINTYPYLIPWKKKGGLPDWELIEDHPTKLNMLLYSGEIVAGLVSSFEVIKNPQLYYVLPYCISSRGDIKSVLLLSRLPIEQLDNKTILLTPHSLSSKNLLFILLKNFFSIHPIYKTGQLDEFLSDGNYKAYLSIGDEALKISKIKPLDLIKFDLASLWAKNTNLPFVFAIWTIRANFYERYPDKTHELKEFLHDCLKTGLDMLEKNDPTILSSSILTMDECYYYLKGIDYFLETDSVESLKLYFNLCKQVENLGEEFTLRIIDNDIA